MSEIHESFEGKRVTFVPDFYVNRLMPLRHWAGVVVEKRTSLTGQPTKYLVLLDEQFQAEALEKDVDALEEEIQHSEPINS